MAVKLNIPRHTDITHKTKFYGLCVYVKNTLLTNSYHPSIFVLYEKVRTILKESNTITREKGNVCTRQIRTKTTFDRRNGRQPSLGGLDDFVSFYHIMRLCG